MKVSNLEMDIISFDRISTLGKDTCKNIIKYGRSASCTDFAIVTGNVYKNSNNEVCNVPSDSSLKGRAGVTWLNYPIFDGNGLVLTPSGCLAEIFAKRGYAGIRPVIKTRDNTDITTLFDKSIASEQGIEEVNMGYYPQFAFDKKDQDFFSNNYSYLDSNDFGYTVNTVNLANNRFIRFMELNKIPIYSFKGKKAVRVMVNSSYENTPVLLSNGIEYNNGEYVWIEVSPVTWFIDKENNELLSKRILLSGMPLEANKDSYHLYFNQTFLYQFLNNYFLKEMLLNDNNLNLEMENIKKRRLIK